MNIMQVWCGLRPFKRGYCARFTGPLSSSSVDLGLEGEALEICKGLVLGFYRLDHEESGELLRWAPEFVVETAAYALEIWYDGARPEQFRRHRRGRKRAVLPEDFVEQFVPDWSGMIERVLSKPRA